MGADTDDFHLSVRAALRQAAEGPFRLVELPVDRGDLTPVGLSTSARRHLFRFVDGLGLRLCALTADLPELGWTEANLDQRISRTRAMMDLAADWGTPIVVSQVGHLVDPQSRAPTGMLVEAVSNICEHADARGVQFALRPTCNAGDELATFLGSVGCHELRVCLDPAALVMAGVNPLSSIDRIIEQVAIIHIRDGTVGSAESAGTETALGEGQVDFVGLRSVLKDVEYDGPYVLRRTTARDPLEELIQAHRKFAEMLP